MIANENSYGYKYLNVYSKHNKEYQKIKALLHHYTLNMALKYITNKLYQIIVVSTHDKCKFKKTIVKKQ